MSLLGFGQPQTGVFQMAYVVEDIEASMRRWIDELKIGPWFLLAHFTGEQPTYRGEPSEAEVSLAMAHAGHMLVELIEMDAATDAAFTRFYAACLAWDGSDPVRPFA